MHSGRRTYTNLNKLSQLDQIIKLLSQVAHVSRADGEIVLKFV